MLCEVRFVVFVPVEVAVLRQALSVYINCTYISRLGFSRAGVNCSVKSIGPPSVAGRPVCLMNL
jgi:hypothetical protein